MVRVTLIALMILGLLVGIAPAAAQDSAAAGPKLGEPASIYDNTGEPIGTVTVTEILDPYSDFDVTSSPPARGYRWVIATMTFEAGSRAMPLNTSGFLMIDSAGFSAYQGYYYQNSDEAAKYPQFTVSEVPAGEKITGSVYFQVFNEEKPALIEYSPVYEQIIVAVDLREAKVAPGGVTTWNATDGSEIGEISVAGVIDPFEDYDSSYPPQRGFRYVSIAVSFTNTGTRPVQLSSYNFSAIDHEGFYVGSSGIYRTPESTASIADLPYDPVPAGSSVSGLVTFVMINGATLKEVVFTPSSDRRIRIAEYERDATFEPPALTPVATVAVDPACESVVAWGTAATTALVPLAGAFELIDRVSTGDTTVEPQAIRDSAATFDAAADSLEDLDVPAEAEAAAEQLSSVVRGLADQLEKIADDLEAENTDAVTADIAALYEQAFSLTGGAYSELAVRCPGLNDI